MHLGGTVRKLLTAAIAAVVITAISLSGGTAVSEPTAAGTTAAEPTATEPMALQVVGVTADINYTCRNVTVAVKPKDVQYDLVIYYEDRVTGRQGKALVGPMQGKTVEPYGNGIVFTSVDVMVNGGVIGSETILAKCYPDTKASTRAGRAAIRTDSVASKPDERSRNPVPVAMATTDSSWLISPAEES